MEVEVKNLNIHLYNTKSRGRSTKYIHALKNCNLKFNSSEFVGVMGPSGSGKTTLLKALYGILPENSITNGEILVDGKERSHNSWNNFAACVDQDDAVYGEFTVEYTLRQSGLFRLMKGEKFLNVQNNEKSYDLRVEERIEVIIKRLEIQKCRYTKMKNVSGGERKRVMLGIELMARPKILFMDEPTTGLDSLTALNVIKFIKEVSVTENITIFCNIHSPTSQMFCTMDRAILLHEGKIIFNGRTEDTKDFFSNLGISKIEGVSYPEMLLQLCSDDFDYKKYNLKDENLHAEVDAATDVPKQNLIKKNECYIDRRIDFYHIWLLMKRNFKILFINKSSVFKKILINGLYIGILVLLIYLIKMGQPIFEKHNKDEYLRSCYSKGFNPSEEMIKEYLAIKENLKDVGFIEIVKASIIISQTIYISSNCYDIGWNVLSKEISSGSYTSTSLYFAYFVSISIFTFAVNTIMAFLQYAVLKRLFIAPTFIIYSLSVILSIIFGLFIGAVSKTKIVHCILAGLIIMMLFLDDTIFDSCKMLAGYAFSNEKILKVFNTTIDTILTITPYFISKKIIEALYFKFLPKNDVLADDVNENFEEIEGFKHFLDKFKLDVKRWSVLFICNMMLWMLLTLFISGRILGSNNRLKLEKKR